MTLATSIVRINNSKYQKSTNQHRYLNSSCGNIILLFYLLFYLVLSTEPQTDHQWQQKGSI